MCGWLCREIDTLTLALQVAKEHAEEGEEKEATEGLAPTAMDALSSTVLDRLVVQLKDAKKVACVCHGVLLFISAC